MTAGAEGQVGRRGTLADQTVTVINLLLVLGILAANLRGVGRVGLPAVGVPDLGVGEVGGIGSRDSGGGEKGVAGGDNELGAGDGHGRLDGAHDGVDGSVQAEGLLDDGLVEGQLCEVLVLQGRQIGTENADLLLVELLHDLGVLGETEHDPGAGGRRRVLTGHEESDHHVGDFVVGDLGAVLVGGVHKVGHDVKTVSAAVVAAVLDGVHVDLSNGALGVIALLVPGERRPVQGEVDGGEAHVEVVVQSSEGLVELVADLGTLERVGSGENGDLGHLRRQVDNAGVGLEVRVALEVVGNLVGDDRDVGAEGLGGQGDLHELEGRELSATKLPAGEFPRQCTFFCSMSLALGQS